MNILRPETLVQFLDTGRSFLVRHEAEHGLLLGVATATVSPPREAYWALVLDRGEVVAAALRTGTRLILSREGVPGAMATLATDAASPYLHRVLGPPSAVERFAMAHGGHWSPVMSQGIYECRAVVGSPPVRGAHRVARMDDRDVLAAWSQRLHAEAVGESITAEDALERVDDKIARASLHVWTDGDRLVSVAAAVDPTPHGIRINHVYTPPEFRGSGYASALVAALTDAMLVSGRQFAFLHTDLSNPTSNKIYLRIGYRRVADLQVLAAS